MGLTYIRTFLAKVIDRDDGIRHRILRLIDLRLPHSKKGRKKPLRLDREFDPSNNRSSSSSPILTDLPLHAANDPASSSLTSILEKGKRLTSCEGSTGLTTRSPRKPLHESLVLLAEDNKISQVILLKLLKSLSIEADLAKNGSEAVKLAGKKPYDIILMDLHMPVMDGLEATSIILANSFRRRKPQIIALTANILKEDETNCLRAGMSGFLPKPITSELLRQGLCQALSA